VGSLGLNFPDWAYSQYTVLVLVMFDSFRKLFPVMISEFRIDSFNMLIPVLVYVLAKMMEGSFSMFLVSKSGHFLLLIYIFSRDISKSILEGFFNRFLFGEFIGEI
jgi:hypothetical protein